MENELKNGKGKWELEKIADRCASELRELGILIGKVTDIQFIKEDNVYGRCRKNKDGTFTILVSTEYESDEADIYGLKKLFYHELLHTCPDDDSIPDTGIHGPKWRRMARRVDREFGCRIMGQSFTDSIKRVLKPAKLRFVCPQCGGYRDVYDERDVRGIDWSEGVLCTWCFTRMNIIWATDINMLGTMYSILGECQDELRILKIPIYKISGAGFVKRDGPDGLHDNWNGSFSIDLPEIYNSREALEGNEFRAYLYGKLIKGRRERGLQWQKYVREVESVFGLPIIKNKGITSNDLFQNVSWVNKLKEFLIPIQEMFTIKRGERNGWDALFCPPQNSGIESEYIKPALKNPALLKSYTAQSDSAVFCCHKTEEALRHLGHTGALNWISKHASVTNKIGKFMSDMLKQPGRFWYELDVSTKADFVMTCELDKRLFISMPEENTFVYHMFNQFIVKDINVSKDLIHALLNSLFGMLTIEAARETDGSGVSSTKLRSMYMINPRVISDSDALEIVELFNKIKNRNVMDIEDELKDSDRENFDRKVLQAVGHEEIYDALKESLLLYTRYD